MAATETFDTLTFGRFCKASPACDRKDTKLVFRRRGWIDWEPDRLQRGPSHIFTPGPSYCNERPFVVRTAWIDTLLRSSFPDGV